MSLSYGVSGIKKKSWLLSLYDLTILDDHGYQDIRDLALSGQNVGRQIFHGSYLSVGQLDDNSVVLTGDDGDEIEANFSGTVPIDKACAFSADLINLTVENANKLEELDGTQVVAILREVVADADPVNYQGWSVLGNRQMFIIMENVTLSYSENLSGGDIMRGTIRFAKNPSKIGDFRIIGEFRKN